MTQFHKTEILFSEIGKAIPISETKTENRKGCPISGGTSRFTGWFKYRFSESFLTVKLLLIFHVFIMEPSTQFEDIRRAKLAQFVLVLLSLERIPQLADPTRLETFFTVD